MTSKYRKAIKAGALFLVFCVSHVYVQANLTKPGVTTNGAASNMAQGDELFGRLTTRRNSSILVNGNNVGSGTTILSGAQLQTPDGVGATVLLQTVGKIDIAPKTNLTVAFNKGNVEVSLVTGCLILNTDAGTKGAVKTPQGTTQITGVEKSSSMDICAGEPGAASPVLGQGAAANAGAGSLVTSGGGPTGLNPAATVSLVVAAGAALISDVSTTDRTPSDRPAAIP